MPSFFRCAAPARRLLLYPLLLVMLLSLTGCLKFKTLITVKDDGSGTIEQFFALSGPMLEMITAFVGDDDLCQEEDLNEAASKFGEGVELTSFEPIDEDDTLGCRSTFAFNDINALAINRDPGSQMPDGMSGNEEPSPEEQVRFYFTPGSPTTLVMTVPKAFDETPGPPPNETPIEEIREMLEGGHIDIAVEIDGTIIETDATYLDGARITLLEMDFNKLLEDEENFQQVSNAQPTTAEEVRALLEIVEGLKIETNEEVTVRFE